MKTWMMAGLAGLAACIAAEPCRAAGGYWVVGNNQTHSCGIETSNPTLDVVGPRFFGSGPYRSLKDAKLARSTIPQCPKIPNTDKDDQN